MKNNILTAELYDPVKSFDENLYICEKCDFRKNETPCQTVCNKIALPTWQIYVQSQQ